jgi:hypothetical protein
MHHRKPANLKKPVWNWRYGINNNFFKMHH